MARLLSYTLLAFISGFVAGNVVGSRGFGVVGGNDRDSAAIGLQGATEQDSARRPAAIAAPQVPKYADSAATRPVRQAGPVSVVRDEGAGSKPYEDFRDRLPPHVGTPYFFGDPDDPAVLQQRVAAAEDFLASMERAGLTAEEMAAMREAVGMQLSAPLREEVTVVKDLSVAERVRDLAQSLRADAQATEEFVQETVDALRTGVVHTEDAVLRPPEPPEFPAAGLPAQ